MAMTPGESSNMHRASVLHLLTPPAELAAMRDPTAGVNLMDRHHLYRYEAESGRTLRRGISHFLSPQLQVLIKEKPRIALSEKADFAELLSESPSGRPIQELSIDLLRRSFMIRRRVVTAGVSASASQDEEAAVPGRPPVPPDVPMLEQTTNKLSPAFAKKQSKRARSVEREEASSPPPADVKFFLKPLISKLMAMKWAGWGNPFNIVLKKNNAPARYFEYVKRPMNLTYIRDNISRNKYMTVAEMEADLELTVNNALTFNPATDPVHHYALELQSAFRSELPQIKRALEVERGEGQVGKKARV